MPWSCDFIRIDSLRSFGVLDVVVADEGADFATGTVFEDMTEGHGDEEEAKGSFGESCQYGEEGEKERGELT